MASKASVNFIDRWLVRMILKTLGEARVRIVLWNGEAQDASNAAPLATITIADRHTLFQLALNPDLHFGFAYSDGRLRVDGDLLALLEAAGTARRPRGIRRLHAELISRWITWLQANSTGGSRLNIHRHYDLNADFFRLWLDSQLLYTCAYFPEGTESLESAQVAKMDYVCRKVQLQPGESVVEAGCGWGALALHMAGCYGVRVRAFNISREQIVYAQRRAAAEGLSDRVEFIEDDYRNITGRYDAFLSVGMVEHVGRERYRLLGEVIDRCLPSSGRGLVHFIGRNRPAPLNSWIRKRIFPGAYPPTLKQAMEIFESSDLSVLDVENLRLHYARTLEYWLARFERSAAQVHAMFGEEFTRSWRLYLAGSIASFRTGWMQLFQITFARARNNRIAWTRRHLYESAPTAAQESEWTRAMS